MLFYYFFLLYLSLVYTVNYFYLFPVLRNMYGGPWVSRHNQIPLGTTKYLTAQTNSSRQNQITNRKTKNFHGKSK